MFSSSKKKTVFFQKTKEDLENEILNQIPSETELFSKVKGMLTELWANAEKEAKKEFETLPEKLQFNSFYLQEVMHKYIESIIKVISENK